MQFFALNLVNMSIMRRLLPIIIFSLLLGIPAAALAAVRIQGKITDENNEPLEFVPIPVQGDRKGAG